MAFIKLTAQLQAFDKPKLKKLNQYLQSPYFEVPSGAVLLFNYLEKLYPQFDEKKLSNTLIAKKIPLLNDPNKQAKAGTALLKAVEHFLMVEEWQTKTTTHPLYLLQAQKQLGAYEVYENTAHKYWQQIATCPEKDIDYFSNRHLLTEIEHTGFEARLQRNHKNNLQPVTQTLDEFYAIKKLRYHCELISRHQILGTPYNPENTAQLLQTLEPFTNPQHPYVFLFANMYNALAAPVFEQGELYYSLLHRYIAQSNFTVLPQGVKETIPYLINYCLYWNNQGYEQAGTNALWWYELKIRHGLLIEKEKLQPSDFRNIVSLAIISGKPEKWLKQFIETNSAYLPREMADTNTAFARAQYFYYVKNYDKAMPYFQQAQAKDEPIFHMIVKRWQFICLYEQNPDSKTLLLDFVTSWERQLHRTAPALHQLKEVFAKVISYSKKLLTTGSQKQKNELAKTLQQEPFFAGKNWLLLQLKK